MAFVGQLQYYQTIEPNLVGLYMVPGDLPTTVQSATYQIKAQAEQDQKTYDSLNYRDDQFDLSDAALAIAIALLAVAALTRIWWMYWLSWVPIGFGVLMGLSGLLGWALHPDRLTSLLT